MNIENIDKIVYNYIFEIDEIKKCMYIYISNYSKICKLHSTNNEIVDKIDKRKISNLSKEFKDLCYKLIRKDSITDTETYSNIVNTLRIINSKVQSILQKSQYTSIKDKEIQNQFKEIKLGYSKVNTMLTADSVISLFISAHLTTFFIIFLSIGIFLIFISLACSLINYIEKGIIFILFLIVLLVGYLVLLLNFKKIDNSFRQDKTIRTIYKNTYLKSKKMSFIENKLMNTFGNLSNKF